MSHSQVQVPSRADFEARMNQRGRVLWFTGLSGSGKSTLADALAAKLFEGGSWISRLDGDALRSGLCSDLGFSAQARTENLRRFAHVAHLMLRQGLVVLVSTISPRAQHRALVRELLGDEDYLHLHVDTPLKVCQARDPKGLYAKARRGEIPNFTGVSAPYERPDDADLQVRTDRGIDDSLRQILDFLG